MGARCYDCGEKFGRCYEHAGDCPDECSFGVHDCPGDPWGAGDYAVPVEVVPAPEDVDW